MCAATNPETALHINCKLALAAALRAAIGSSAALSISRRCAGSLGLAATCPETLVRGWVHDWDDVLVEHRAGAALRPDLLLKRGGSVIAAIEILVSHTVSPDKAKTLADLGVAWIEVRADERVATPGGWTPSEPLMALHASDEYEWRCPVHRATHVTAVAARAETRDAEREAARHSTALIAARVVDVYHAGGSRERVIHR
ncbi:MAG: hypothetical protein ACREPM_26035, partial [Gemmatimonadaceae bacterium]